MLRRISFYLLAVLAFCDLSSQSVSDWIDFNQSYIKLKIAEDGWYRVTASELQQVGFPVSSVPAAQIQLFRRGQEVAINTQTVSGGALDYFEFWGEKNTGAFDTELYRAEAQPHTYHSLFTDTATYFLTWSNTSNHLRIQNNTQNDNTGLTPITVHKAVDQMLQTNDYATGRLFGGSNGNDFQLSDYDHGEGWTGSRVAKGSSQDFEFSLSEYEVEIDSPQFEIIAVGRNSLQHVVTVLAGPDGTSLTTANTFTFTGYTSYRHLFKVDPALIGPNGELTLRCTVTGVAGASDFVSFSSVKVEYPQTLSIPIGTSKTFQFEPNGSTRYYLQIATPSPEDYTYYDVSDPYQVLRLPQNSFSNRSDIVLPGADVPRKIVALNSFKTVPSLQVHAFEPITVAGRDYLIITHELLRNGSDGSDPVADYAAYRASAAGGNHQVTVAEIDDIYDQFNYGDPSVIAIRRLFEAGYSEGISQALILGKGRTVNQNFYRKSYNQDSVDILSTSEIFIPTYGIPGGDNMFSVGLSVNEPLLPVVPTGRINAWQPEQITAYLEKVKEMEATPFDQLWRKKLIHLSGGTTNIELSAFASYIQDFKEVAEGDFLGGRAFNQNKQTSAVSEQFDISTQVNQGVGFITIFGHSSNTVTDVEIGKPSSESFNYNNAGKYPFIIVNGCKAGEIFGNTISFGEDWITFPSKGAIGFLAHADQASSVNLKRYTDRIYDIGFADTAFFGYDMGEVLTEASRQYYNSSAGSSESSQTQIQQTLFQGDPACSFFGPSVPDFALLSDKVRAESTGGEQLLAQQDSFLLKVPILNFGRTIQDSIQLGVERTYPDGSLESYRFLVSPIRYADTIQVYLTNSQDRLIEGENNLTVRIDPVNEIDELDEFNNEGNTTIFISAGSTQHILPYDLATVIDDTVRLLWQSTDPLEALRGYQLTVDTTANFNSPFLQEQIISGENLISYELDLNGLPEQTVIYWRTRFAEVQIASDTVYETSSFTYAPGGKNGWGQFSFEQFSQNELAGLTFDQQTLDLSFETLSLPVGITTQGTDFFDYDQLRVLVNGGDQLATNTSLDPFCLTNTFNALVFDKNNGQLKRPIAIPNFDYENDLVCGRLPQMIYNFTANELLVNRRIEELVNNMGNGDQVVFFNMDSVAYSSFDSPIQDALAQVGIDPSIWSGLVDGQPLVVFGQKGIPAGNALIISSDGSGLLPKQQTIITDNDIIATEEEGTITSAIIGPATAWDELAASIEVESSDLLLMSIYGISNEGASVLVPLDEYTGTIDLSGIDASTYPYLYLMAVLSDAGNLTPPQINHLEVSFTGSPEGLLIPLEKQTLELLEGQDIAAAAEFINVSKVAYSDSLVANIEFLNNETELVKTNTLKFPPLDSGDTLSIEFETSSVGFAGSNSFSVSVQANQAERIVTNNRFTFGEFAEVAAEDINPVLDVTIDGRYILNGEIVSSSPMIRVNVSDENQFLLKEDTTGVELALKRPQEESFSRVAFSDPLLNWSAATAEKPFEINYQPSLSDDGIYVLRVEASDESGNLAGEEPYEISFEVLNQSSITNFFPYPNPFSTQCRFVFTLTGSVIPDELMIQIMTLSGRVVKTIDEVEIGPIHIGNNITEYAWDGRDEFGDLLANGVYLYRVIVQSNGENLDQRNTVADQAFKNGIGKLYILR